MTDSPPRFTVDPQARYETPEKPLTDHEAHRVLDLARKVKNRQALCVLVKLENGRLQIYDLDRAA